MVQKKTETENMQEFHQHFSAHLNSFSESAQEKKFDLTSSVKSLVDETPVKTTVIGEIGVGKSYLLNVLLESTSPSEREYSSIVSHSKGLRGLFSAPAYRKTNYDFFSNDVTPQPFSFSSPGNPSPLSLDSSPQLKPYRSSTYKNCGYSFSDQNEQVLSTTTNLSNSPTYKNSGYTFSDRNEQVFSPTNFEWEIGKIEDTFMPNGDYMNTIQWEKELNNLHENSILDDYHTFLLPQGLVPGQTPYFYCIDLRYGAIPELIVSFMEEIELRSELWALHELENRKKRFQQNASHREILENWYRNILQLRKDQKVPLGNILAPKDFIFPMNIKHLIGKTYRFRGTGFNFHVDRIYIREKLRELILTHGNYVKKVVVKIPCGLLKGNREIVELSSLDVPESFQHRLSGTMDGTNLVLLTLDQKGFTPILQQFLHDYFSESLLKNPDQHKAIFVELTESLGGIDLISQLFDSTIRQKWEQSKQLLLQFFRGILEYQSPNFYCNLDQIINTTPLFSAKPRMFSFIQKQNLAPSTLLQNNYSVAETISATFIPALLGAINSVALTKSALPLKELNRSWMLKLHNEEPNNEITNAEQTSKLLTRAFGRTLLTKQQQPSDIAFNLEKLSISPPTSKRQNSVFMDIQSESSFESKMETTLLQSQNATTIFDKPDLQIVQVKNDENSQFRALAFLVYDTEEAHSICRLLVVNEILSYPEYYRKFLEARGTGNIEIHEYVSSMAQIDQMGDALTLHAFANVYDVDILLHSPIHPQPRLFQPRNARATRSYSLILLPNNIYKPVKLKSCFSMDLLSHANSSNHLTYPPLIKTYILSGLHSPLRKNLQLEEDEEILDEHSLKTSCFSVLPIKQYTPRPLIELCIIKICDNIDCMPNFAEILPEELVQKILRHLITFRQLTPISFQKFIHSSLITMDLSNWMPFTDFLLCGILLKNCPYLRELSIEGCLNVTTSSIELIASKCPNLQLLNVSGCIKIEDAGIQAIARHCSQLIVLNVSECSRLTDSTLVELFANCISLQSLHFRNCTKLSDYAFLSASSEAMDLRELDLTGCDRLSDSAIFQIAKAWPRLTIFKISSRNVTDNSIVEFSRRCSSLQILELSGCELLTDLSVQSIAKNCPMLEILGLAGCRCITDNSFLTAYGRLIHLRSLDVSRCLNLTDVGMKCISHNCPNLVALNLAFCDLITDHSISQLGLACPNLTELNLSKCIGVSGHTLSALTFQLRDKLSKLILYNCLSILTPSSVLQLSTSCSKLKELDLSFCRTLNDDLLKTILMGCPFLEELSVEECEIDSSGIEAIANFSYCMKKLKLAYVKGVTDVSLTKLADGCQFLISLDLSYCPNISIEGIQCALDSWNDLRFLHLRGLHQLSIRGVRSHSLQELNLSWCRNIQDSALEDIWKGCFNLFHLDLQWAGKLTVHSIYHLLHNLPTLRSLNLRGCPCARGIQAFLSTSVAENLLLYT